MPELQPALIDGLNEQEFETGLTDLLYTKNSAWKYEKEYRQVVNPRYFDVLKPRPGQLPVYLFQFPLESVKKVVMGCKMLRSKKDEVTEIVRRKYPHAQLRQAEQDEATYQLSTKPV